MTARAINEALQALAASEKALIIPYSSKSPSTLSQTVLTNWERAADKMGVIAESAAGRELMYERNALNALVVLAGEWQEGTPSTTTARAIWALSRFCEHEKKFARVHVILPALQQLLHASDDKIVAQVLNALELFVKRDDSPHENIEAVLQTDIFPKLIQLLSAKGAMDQPPPKSSLSLEQIAAKSIMCNLLRGSETQFLKIIGLDLLPALLSLLVGKCRYSQYSPIFASLATTYGRIQALIDVGFVSRLIEVLSADSARIQLQAVQSLLAILSKSTPDQLQCLVQQGFITPLCYLVKESGGYRTSAAIEVLTLIMEKAPAEKMSATAQQILNCGAIGRLCQLQWGDEADDGYDNDDRRTTTAFLDRFFPLSSAALPPDMSPDVSIAPPLASSLPHGKKSYESKKDTLPANQLVELRMIEKNIALLRSEEEEQRLTAADYFRRLLSIGQDKDSKPRDIPEDLVDSDSVSVLLRALWKLNHDEQAVQREALNIFAGFGVQQIIDAKFEMKSQGKKDQRKNDHEKKFISMLTVLCRMVSSSSSYDIADVSSACSIVANVTGGSHSDIQAVFDATIGNTGAVDYKIFPALVKLMQSHASAHSMAARAIYNATAGGSSAQLDLIAKDKVIEAYWACLAASFKIDALAVLQGMANIYQACPPFITSLQISNSELRKAILGLAALLKNSDTTIVTLALERLLFAAQTFSLSWLQARAVLFDSTGDNLHRLQHHDNPGVSTGAARIISAFELEPFRFSHLPVDLLPTTAGRMRALRGEYFEELLRNVELCAAPRLALLVFISSTFTDTDRERNFLLEKLLPELRAQGRVDGIEVVFVDMRWGVRDENTLDHQTWVACKRELERCHRESAGLFFLSLQGDKYGYRPLPRSLTTTIMQTALARSSDEERRLAEEWYVLDANCDKFVLRSLQPGPDATWKGPFWDAMPILRDGCLHGVEFGDGSELLVGQSVTEWEARYALALPGARERSHWQHRQFDGGVTLQQDPKRWLDDGFQEEISALKDHMRLAIGGVQEAAVSSEEYLAKDAAWEVYLTGFETRARELFRGEMASIVQLKQKWREDGCGVGLPGEELGEVLHHVSWACAKIIDFEGREEELRCAMEVISEWTACTELGRPAEELEEDDEDEDQKQVGKEEDVWVGAEKREERWTWGREAEEEEEEEETEDEEDKDLHGPLSLGGICLAVVGKSGTGKTAFMAKLTQCISEAIPDRPVLIRFCGTSRGSMTGLALMQSLCLQIEIIFRRSPFEAPGTYQEWVKYLHSLLKTHAVVLLIDSLDQLGNDNEERSRLSFLKGVKPHPDTRIIVSCLPDETDALTGKRYFYGCDTRLYESSVPRVEILPLEEGDALATVRQLLARQGRGLTSEQWAVVSTSIQEQAPTALYCRFAERVAASWRSTMSLAQCLLPPSVPTLIDHIFEGIELEFGGKGREWVRVALAIVTFSRAGVSDAEIQDLLSLSDARVLNHVFQYSQPDGVRRFPLHVWLRLKGALKGLLIEREHGCCQWYHRQLKETAEARYAYTEKQLAHELLGTYFGDLCGERGRERLIARQPLTLNDTLIWLPRAQVNPRRCVEAPFHLVAAGAALEVAARRELCSVELVCACALAGQGFELLDAIFALSRITGASNVSADDYTRWLLKFVVAMQAHHQGKVIESCWDQPVNSSCRNDLSIGLVAAMKSLQALTPDEWAHSWTVARPLGGKEGFDALLMVLEGHTSSVLCVALSNDGHRIASGSKDKTVRVWDGVSGVWISTMQGHTGVVFSLCWSPDNERIVSGAGDCTLRVWDGVSGTVFRVLEGHTGCVYSVVWSSDGRRIASASWDKTIRLWDADSGDCVGNLRGHTNPVLSVSFRPDGLQIASGSYDKTVRVWSSLSGRCLSVLNEHIDTVNAVVYCNNGRRLASGSADSTVKVWETELGICLLTVNGWKPNAWSLSFTSVAWSPDSNRIVAANGDSTLRVFDVETGECLATLKMHNDKVRSVAWSRDGRRIISGSHDGTLRVWDGAPLRWVATPQAHTDWVKVVAFSPDSSRIATGSKDETVRIWDVGTGACLYVLQHSAYVASLAWCPDGLRVVTGCGDRTLQVWDASCGEMMLMMRGHTAGVRSVAWSLDKRHIASGSADESLMVWEAESGQCIATLEGRAGWVVKVAWKNDGKCILACTASTTRVWDVDSRTCLLVLSSAFAVAWSPDGGRILSSHGTKISIIDAATGAQIMTWDTQNYLTATTWSPDGQYVVAGGSKVSVWNAETGGLLAVLLEQERGNVSSVDWSPDGRRIAAVAKSQVWLWDGACLMGPSPAPEPEPAALEGEAAALEGEAAALEGEAAALEGEAAALEGEAAAFEVESAALEGESALLDDADSVHNSVEQREMTLKEMGFCGCAGGCSTNRCSCRKAGRRCNPVFCGCCFMHGLCGNLEDILSYYLPHPDFPLVRSFEVNGGQNSLVLATFNVQSLGHNMYWKPFDAGPDFEPILSKPFLAASKKLVEFIAFHSVDFMFIQETIDARALEHVVAGLLNLDLPYKASWVPIGFGFNRSDPKCRPIELAAVIHKDPAAIDPPLPWSLPSDSLGLQVFEYKLEGLHEYFVDMRDRYKRHPAYLCVQFGAELLCLTTMHLATDSSISSLRLNREIASLKPLAEALKAETKSDHVILLGDFGRDVRTLVFSCLTHSGHFPFPSSGRTNQGKVPKCYDTFWVPPGLADRVSATIGGEDWLVLENSYYGGEHGTHQRKISDHLPVLLRLEASPSEIEKISSFP